jgi:hypothetical protein
MLYFGGISLKPRSYFMENTFPIHRRSCVYCSYVVCTLSVRFLVLQMSSTGTWDIPFVTGIQTSGQN